ncbi:sigma 54-interacting transcriptional regulator [Neolewinella agarilytica]|uniref:PAS domain S-box-containing protein n=1 Tax=Neolewinella agarilytica TaxID=478744 RepID=A0A1H9C688_9BACT|nr:sigma 54-interacting transcriptional regulator [Neolewinella agarilytica]SEP96497.1 PAS domain S-box-containing protein [Neolewinella agarilytica]
MANTRSNPQLQLHQVSFDLISEGVLWIDKAGRVTHGNEAAARLLGYPRRELGHLSYFEINPHFSLMAWRKFRSRLKEVDNDRLDTEFVNASGSLFSVRGKCTLDQFPAGEDLCLIIFNSTEAGKRDADLLEALQQHGQIASWEYNLANGQVFLGAPARKWLGWSPEREFYPIQEFQEKIGDALPEGDAGRLKELLQRVLHSGQLFETDLSMTTAGGKQETFSLRGQSVENELEVYKIYGTLSPEVQQSSPSTPMGSESTYRFTLDNSPQAIYWYDLQKGQISFVNARAGERSGFSRQELIGQTLTDLFAEESPGTLDQLLREVRAKQYQELTINILRKSGAPYPARLACHLHNSGDDNASLIILAHDISREQQDNEHLQLHITTLNALREWVIWLDAENKIVLMNAAARRKLGRKTSRDISQVPILELMPDLVIPPLSEIRQEQLDGRVRPDTEYHFSDPGGAERILQIRFAQVAADTRLFLSIICRDVTAEYNNKQRLRQAKRRVDELRQQLESENEVLKEQIETVHAAGPIITVSKKYQKVLGQIAQVADTDATVLVTGETGTGKELLAHSIHNFSNRSSRQMISVNCAALPENLIESELFGHERGAFTGAFAQKKGKFELANGSTIFLDEIGELPLDMQAKLLRALQEGEIQRIGSADIIRVDVRVIAATNRKLEQMITEGTFREDLYYRLNVFPIHNLPLRERREDIPVLVKHFARLYADKMGRLISDINQRDLAQLQDYDFPGNVRELINLVERAVITSSTTTLNLAGSLRVLRRPERSEGGSLNLSGDKLLTFEEMQRQYIIEALKRTKGKVTGPGGAAEKLDVNGRTLMSKMNKLGINRNDYTS